jgi:hypothetical protein
MCRGRRQQPDPDCFKSCAAANEYVIYFNMDNDPVTREPAYRQTPPAQRQRGTSNVQKQLDNTRNCIHLDNLTVQASLPQQALPS